MFEWNDQKNKENMIKHGVTFAEAVHAFFDANRVIAEDLGHSNVEQRYYCFGYDKKQLGVLTVRFTYREHKIRIFGAGYWRRGKKIYEQENKL